MLDRKEIGVILMIVLYGLAVIGAFPFLGISPAGVADPGATPADGDDGDTEQTDTGVIRTPAR